MTGDGGSARASEASRRTRVALVGLRCAGKTSVGARLAALLGVPFVDLDERVAVLANELTAGAALRRLGEPAFRALESRALADALAEPGALVLATGGGCVQDPANRARLAREATCVWLRAPVDVLRRRLAADTTERPALAGASAAAELAALAARREPEYRELAAFAIDTGELSVEEVAARLRARLGGPATSAP